MDFKQGSTDVADYPGTLAIGAGPRTEVFAAVRVVTSIDRDTRPLFAPANTQIGGVVNEYPFVREGWTGNNFGDAYVGAKINLLSEHRRQPLAMAFRGTVKLPTAGEDNVCTVSSTTSPTRSSVRKSIAPLNSPVLAAWCFAAIPPE